MESVKQKIVIVLTFDNYEDPGLGEGEAPESCEIQEKWRESLY